MQVTLGGLRGSFLLTATAVHREASYALIAWCTLRQTFRFSNTIAHIQLMGAIHWSSTIQSLCGGHSGHCAHVKALLAMCVFAFIVEMACNLSRVTIWKRIDSQRMRIGQAVLLLLTDVMFLVASVLFARKIVHDESAPAMHANGGALTSAVTSDSHTFIWVSAASSMASFFSKLIPWEHILAVLTKRWQSGWIQDIRNQAIVVRLFLPGCFRPIHISARVVGVRSKFPVSTLRSGGDEQLS